MTVWPWLMGFAAYLTIGGFLVGNGQTLRIGGAILAAYVLMQLKKIGFAPEYADAISMLIWCSAASFIAHSYGISLTPLMVALLLVLSGTCYLWASMVGAKSGFLVPHATTADLLAIAAMWLVGRGLGGELWGYLSDAWPLGVPDSRGD